MDTLVLLPGFINFFQQAKHQSSSPGKLAITFLAFGNFAYNNHHCDPCKYCILITLVFLTDSIPWCSSECSFCAEPSLFCCHAYITALEQHNFCRGKWDIFFFYLISALSHFLLSYLNIYTCNAFLYISKCWKLPCTVDCLFQVHEKKKTEQWKYDLGWRKNIEQVRWLVF